MMLAGEIGRRIRSPRGAMMVETSTAADVAELPLPPTNDEVSSMFGASLFTLKHDGRRQLAGPPFAAG